MDGEPRYFMGRCNACGENIFLTEENSAHLMARLREIERLSFPLMVFGEYIRVAIFEQGGATDFCQHEFKLVGTFDDKAQVKYLREL